jgi:hypothetical protein
LLPPTLPPDPEALSVATRPAIFNLKIATYSPSQILELPLKRRDAGLGFRVGFNKTEEYTDPSHPAGLLRQRH